LELVIMAEALRRGRSLAETLTYSVASVITVMVFVCFVVGRYIYRFGKWVKKTRRKALFASLEKIKEESFSPDETDIPKGLISGPFNQCPAGHKPFVSYEGLEQLHRFLFVLGITHVLYSCLAVGLAMSKIYSWRRWENQTTVVADRNLQGKRNKVMRRQITFVFHHASHPWSRNPILIWMLCFMPQFRSSIRKLDYFALRLGFIT
ncbi:hypothetical protein S245_036459, partial [Arachis hypogaea]